MKLLLHISHPISEDTRRWINQPNAYITVDKDNWLDCTHLISDFHRNHISEFCGLICEWLGVDLMFNKYKIVD